MFVRVVCFLVIWCIWHIINERLGNYVACMEQCPHCRFEQKLEKGFPIHIDEKTKLLLERPQKLTLYGICFGSATLVLILLKLFLLVDSQARNGNIPTDPSIGFEMIFTAVGISFLVCLGLLLYRSFSYPRMIKAFEKMRKHATVMSTCIHCGWSWTNQKKILR